MQPRLLRCLIMMAVQVETVYCPFVDALSRFYEILVKIDAANQCASFLVAEAS